MKKKLEREKELKKRVFLSVFSFIIVFALSWFNFVSEEIEKYIIFFIASFVQFYIGKDFYVSSLNALKNKIADMNLLVVIGTSVAYFYSFFSLFFPNLFPQNMRNLYFESSVAIITFLLIGKYLEEKARNKASSFIRKLLEIKPKKATILIDGKEIEIDADSIVYGDLIVLKEGDKVPIDAIVVDGKCELDNSAITGESLPVL
ncbi:MAG TPA: heavy metal translocating P-type ATPase, partial [Hydrogenothermaceae bacterium]|nr:heavy metal translocating P-type ATPase [Hydrogenothermaceae bacterium]